MGIQDCVQIPKKKYLTSSPMPLLALIAAAITTIGANAKNMASSMFMAGMTMRVNMVASPADWAVKVLVASSIIRLAHSWYVLVSTPAFEQRMAVWIRGEAKRFFPFWLIEMSVLVLLPEGSKRASASTKSLFLGPRPEPVPA